MVRPAEPEKYRATLMAQQQAIADELIECRQTLRTSTEGHARDDIVDEACHLLTLRMQQLRAELHEVEDALDQLAQGQYGRCTDCGRRIPVARLRANPTATRCCNCQSLADRVDGRA